jgi:hypothetical protein
VDALVQQQLHAGCQLPLWQLQLNRAIISVSEQHHRVLVSAAPARFSWQQDQYRLHTPQVVDSSSSSSLRHTHSAF